MKFSCVIIDDEPLAREVMESYIATYEALELNGSYENVATALAALRTNSPHILFLDIEMPGATGLDLLSQWTGPTLTVLTTAYRDYALEAYDLGVIDYLVKPIRYARFKKAVDRAVEFLQAKKMEVEILRYEKQTTVAVKSGTKNILLPAESISHVQGLKDYSILYTNEKKYVVNGSIKTMLESLPKEQFIRVHKSFIVARQKIGSLQGNKIEFGDYQIPVGRVYRANLNELLKLG